MKNIINNKLVDYTKEPMFFGEELNMEVYNEFRYENIFSMFKQHKSFFWRPEEFDLTKDRNDFSKLSDNEKFIFTSNLSYQILLDSVQSRGIPHLLEHCSSPEIEAFASAWQFFETVHSYSYSYLIKAVYPNPKEIFDFYMQSQINKTSQGSA